MTDDYEKTYNTFNEVAQKAMNRFYRNCLDATRDEMTKIEVTDEMVERFCDYVNTHEGYAYRDALEAALNPPPEPEIVVTEEMVNAGRSTYPGTLPKDLATVAMINEACRRIYRAMRKLEPKAEPFVAHAVPAPGQPWVRGLHYDWREMRKWGSGSGSGNCDR